MEAPELTEHAVTQGSPVQSEPPAEGRSMFTPQGEPGSCPTCATGSSNGTTPPTYVYALGSIEPTFPDISVEKEFAQVIRRSDTKGLTNRQAIAEVLSKRENRYLARQVCWVMKIEKLETYILLPRDPADFELLIGAVRPSPNPSDVDVVIGHRGPLATAGMCNGLQAYIVAFDQLYSFDRDALIKAIPRPEKMPAKEATAFASAAEEVFDRIQQSADNAGATDEHRAINYLAVRYDAIYALTADAHARNNSLQEVNVHPSRLSGLRKIMDVVFTYTNRGTDVTEKYFARVDVTGEFPFMVTKLSPYYDRV
jgi:hypothetical protein